MGIKSWQPSGGIQPFSLASIGRDELQERRQRLSIEARVKRELVVRVRHLAGGDTLRHANIQGCVQE